MLQVAVGGLVGQTGSLGDGFHGKAFLAVLQRALDQLQGGYTDTLDRHGRTFLTLDILFELTVAVHQSDVQPDAADNIRCLDGLQCKITGARLQELIGDLLALINGENDNRNIRIQFPNHLNSLDTIDLGQMIVDQHQVRVLGAKQFQSRRHILGGNRVPALKLKHRPQGKENLFLIVDHQDLDISLRHNTFVLSLFLCSFFPDPRGHRTAAQPQAYRQQHCAASQSSHDPTRLIPDGAVSGGGAGLRPHCRVEGHAVLRHDLLNVQKIDHRHTLGHIPLNQSAVLVQTHLAPGLHHALSQGNTLFPPAQGGPVASHGNKAVNGTVFFIHTLTPGTA